MSANAFLRSCRLLYGNCNYRFKYLEAGLKLCIFAIRKEIIQDITVSGEPDR
ncbi:hypothetical protein HMPREF0663_10229 [Hoylesella oralis ATCC 33269]|uniref:Uncharacterized protein n=1 Tax=Hoylesella oralis ATCC 33269 TaxID=873533 RepID=E7RM79_9BACT|nr:hypothetical protein HMPREF0663_10229 [Hoylesella oralis ATCC 33269]